MNALQAMYLASVVVAGVPGLIILFFPAVAVRYIFMDEVADDHITRILGSVLLSIGVVAVAGVVDPLKYSPLLLFQLAFMLVWLLFDAVPAFLAGRTSRPQKVYSAVFGVWSAALTLTIPFDYF